MVQIDACEHFHITKSSLGGANYQNLWINANATTTGPILSNITVDNCLFDSAYDQDVLISGDGAKSASNVFFTGNNFNGENTSDYALRVSDFGSGVRSVYNLNFVGNSVEFYLSTGLYILDGLASTGIYIGGRCSKFNIRDNMIGGSQTFGDYDASANKCLYGIYVASFGTTNIGVINNNNTPTAASIGTISDLVYLNKGNSSTFANLPPTPATGSYATVTNSNTATWGANIAGGGANVVLAFYNGTNWTVAGK
jgi:hypothetical protein